VATDVGGVRDLVGDAAVLVPAGDTTALAAGLMGVLDDERLRRQLRTAGPVRAATWPTVDEMVDRIVADYLDLNSMVTSRGRPAGRDTPSDEEDHGADA